MRIDPKHWVNGGPQAESEGKFVSESLHIAMPVILEAAEMYVTPQLQGLRFSYWALMDMNDKKPRVVAKALFFVGLTIMYVSAKYIENSYLNRPGNRGG